MRRDLGDPAAEVLEVAPGACTVGHGAHCVAVASHVRQLALNVVWMSPFLPISVGELVEEVEAGHEDAAARLQVEGEGLEKLADVHTRRHHAPPRSGSGARRRAGRGSPAVGGDGDSGASPRSSR